VLPPVDVFDEYPVIVTPDAACDAIAPNTAPVAANAFEQQSSSVNISRFT
jgi:hypothetical protein